MVLLEDRVFIKKKIWCDAEAYPLFRDMGHPVVVDFAGRQIGNVEAVDSNPAVGHHAQPGNRFDQLALKKTSQLAVLNANYIKEKLKQTFQLAYDRPCMHECVFSDQRQQAHKITTLDMVKRLMDYGYHPPTIYFPLVVPGAIMIEPTESESKEDIDQFIEALKSIAAEAEKNPELLLEAPKKCRRRRLDETAAARKPCLTG